MAVYLPHPYRLARLALAWLILLVPLGGLAEPANLKEQIQLLAKTQGINIKGLDRVQEEAVRPITGEPDKQISKLLQDYDHILQRGPDQKIQRLIILGRKQVYVPPPPPPPPPKQTAKKPVEIPTQREGTQHSVEAQVQGAEGQTEAVQLLIDTGASTVVLPNSMAPRLGLNLSTMEMREVQTAKGKAPAHLGRIAGLKLGEARFSDVKTAFIEDADLGGVRLLGMSVLGGMRITLDDQANRLILESPN